MEHYRIAENTGVCFVTFTVIEWLPIFVYETTCKIITDSLNFSIQNKRLGVNAYVIMLDHLHAILFDKDADNERLRHTIDDLRKSTGRKLLEYADGNLSTAFGRAFRDNAGDNLERKFWQPSKHAQGIFNESLYCQKLNYIHLNPVHKGLVRAAQDWRFSSAAYWLEERCWSGDQRPTANDVELSAIGWG
jgi:REP element-mobilizing transposase RayT